jgi:hypothetical protein
MRFVLSPLFIFVLIQFMEASAGLCCNVPLLLFDILIPIL